jgi:hypothetical protein
MLDQKVKKEINYGYVVEIGYHSFEFPNAFTASRFMSEAVRGLLRTDDYKVSSMGYIGDIVMKPIVIEDEEDEEVEEDKED